MRQAQTILEMTSEGPGLYEFTARVTSWCANQGIADGLLTVYIAHTSASLTIQENADPDVLHDIEVFFRRLVSRDPGLYRHGAEGPDDMPAHIRAALTSVSLSIPVAGGQPVLGTWQGIYLYEHRDRPHQRQVHLHLIGA
jgi:secondary thiamine-phosphate synthase enzyme